MGDRTQYDVWYTVPGLLPRCETVTASSPERAAESALVGVRNGRVDRVEITKELLSPGCGFKAREIGRAPAREGTA